MKKIFVGLLLVFFWTNQGLCQSMNNPLQQLVLAIAKKQLANRGRAVEECGPQ